MIVRVWRATIEAGNVAGYRDFLEKQIIPKMRRVPGNLGGELLVSESGPVRDVIVLSRWTSMEAVRGFTGDDVRQASVEPPAVRLLKTYDTTAEHFELMLEARP